MTEEQIRNLIREEMSGMLGYVFSKHIQILDGRNIQVGSTIGTQIGTSITQKLSVYGKTPIVQRSGATQNAVSTTGSTQTTPYGYSTSAQADGIITLLNELRAALVVIGIIKGSS